MCISSASVRDSDEVVSIIIYLIELLMMRCQFNVIFLVSSSRWNPLNIRKLIISLNSLPHKVNQRCYWSWAKVLHHGRSQKLFWGGIKFKIENEISSITILMSLLLHKKFTWPDFGLIFYMPIYPPSLRPCIAPLFLLMTCGVQSWRRLRR